LNAAEAVKKDRSVFKNKKGEHVKTEHKTAFHERELSFLQRFKSKANKETFYDASFMNALDDVSELL